MTVACIVASTLREMNSVEPHQFVPLRRFFNRGRCRVCYQPETLHPTTVWEASRPLGDNTPASPLQARFHRLR